MVYLHAYNRHGKTDAVKSYACGGWKISDEQFMG
jgi:hypothetical protein